MNKLNLAIIGQGRSGRDIHGAYYRSEQNQYFNVKYVVDEEEHRRAMSQDYYEGCTVLSDYKQLFEHKDIDLVVNASFSNQHYQISLDLLQHGYNVLVEKPLAANKKQCQKLISTAKKQGVLLAVFLNTLFAPYYVHAKKVYDSGVLGKIEQISVQFNGFSRRWDWQTLQKRLGGNAYNTGPHPIGIALGLIDFAPNYKIRYSKLAHTTLSSGDADDYAKFVLTAPNKPLVDVEINSTDAFSDYNIKIQGSNGTLKSRIGGYQLKYIVDGENPDQPLHEEFIHDENWNPIYCWEKLVTHEEQGDFVGTAFEVGTGAIYKQVYECLTQGKPMPVTASDAMLIVDVIATLHKQNPLPRKF